MLCQVVKSVKKLIPDKDEKGDDIVKAVSEKERIDEMQKIIGVYFVVNEELIKNFKRI